MRRWDSFGRLYRRRRRPRIEIAKSGVQVVFKIVFLSGKAWLYSGTGPLAALHEHDVKGWTYGVSINLDLKAVEKNDIGKEIRVPATVRTKLEHFLDNMFEVSSLFLDFDSTDLLDFDPAGVKACSNDGKALDQLAEFMQFFLMEQRKQGNPLSWVFHRRRDQDLVRTPGSRPFNPQCCDLQCLP